MKAYYYLFYKIYKFYEKAPARFWSDWKASISITALEIWLLFLLFNVRSLIKNEILELKISHPIIIVPFLLFLIINYYLFIYTDRWKEYMKEFDELPRPKNTLGGIIVWVLIISIIVGFFVSAYFVQRDVLGM